MAPQRGIKKSSATSLLHTATRQGQQRTRRQVIEEVEVLDDIDDTNAMKIGGELADEEEIDESPKSTNNTIEELMNRMVDDQRKRLATRKRGVKKSYDTDRETLRKSINHLFDEHEKKASLAHEAQLKRLRELLAQKARIEAVMADRLKHMRETYDAHSRDLEAVITCKIKSLK